MCGVPGQCAMSLVCNGPGFSIAWVDNDLDWHGIGKCVCRRGTGIGMTGIVGKRLI